MKGKLCISFLISLPIMLLMNGVMAQSLSKKEFEAYVIKAKEAGVTYVDITKDIPPDLRQFDTPDDPYPAWYMNKPALLKIFPPENLQPYMNMDYAKKIIELLKARNEILRKHNLKAYYSTNEPHVLPEAFFRDNPHLRGPRIDQVNRSRTARFAPCVDQPETMEMYRKAIKKLLETLPQVQIFSFLTTDAGSGLCWSPGLYPGTNGPSWCKTHTMADRVKGLMDILEEAANEVGRDIQVDMHGIAPRQWMLPTFDEPQKIAQVLPEGFSLDGYTGEGAEKIHWRRIRNSYAFFPPIVGVPNPLGSINGILNDLKHPNAPLIASFPLSPDLDFSFKLYEKIQENHPANYVEVMASLRELAVELAGEKNSDDLMIVWKKVYSAKNHLNALNFGPVFRMGNILARWVDRPMVPFPEELSDEEKSYYRPFLFQAKDEEQANNLIDTQAMRMYEGYGARLLVQRVTELAMGDLKRARQATKRLIDGAANKAKADKWELLDKRLAVVQSFTRSVDNMVGYQALLELSKNDGNEPEPNPVLGAKNSWKREALTNLARDEIDNAAELKVLLLSTDELLIYTATTPEEENIQVLSPDLPNQLQKKINIMNSKWLDYNLLFTRPNP